MFPRITSRGLKWKDKMYKLKRSFLNCDDSFAFFLGIPDRCRNSARARLKSCAVDSHHYWSFECRWCPGIITVLCLAKKATVSVLLNNSFTRILY